MIQFQSLYFPMHTLILSIPISLFQASSSVVAYLSFAIVVILSNEVGRFYEEGNYSSLVAARRATDAAYVQPAIADEFRSYCKTRGLASHLLLCWFQY